MAQEYSQRQLERMVVGAIEDPNCVFYEQSKMIPELSREAKRRIYKTVLMVKYTQPGVTDWAPQRAQKADIENNQEAYNYFLETKGDIGAPSIEIIPGIDPGELQELIDYGLLTITKLCEANTLPAHLLHVQASARRINEVFKNEQQANKEGDDQETTESSDHEGQTTPGRTSRVAEHIRTGRSGDDRTVSEDCRRINARDVIRPDIETGAGIEERETAERVRPSRRINSGTGITRPEGKIEPLYPSYNWSMSIN